MTSKIDSFFGVPLEHTLISLVMAIAIYIGSRDVLAATTIPTTFFVSREFRDWQKGSGFGWNAFLCPTAAMLVLYIYGKAFGW